jgi:hypothetical protein
MSLAHNVILPLMSACCQFCLTARLCQTDKRPAPRPVPCDQTSGCYVVIRDEVLQRDVELIRSAQGVALRAVLSAAQ